MPGSRSSKDKLCRRSYTTVPIDEGPEVAHSQPHLQEQVLAASVGRDELEDTRTHPRAWVHARRCLAAARCRGSRGLALGVDDRTIGTSELNESSRRFRSVKELVMTASTVSCAVHVACFSF